MRQRTTGCRERMRRPGGFRVGIAGICGLVLAGMLGGCDGDDVRWEAARGAVGSSEGDEVVLAEQWRLYRESVARALQSMSTVLKGARGELAADERGRIDALEKRIAALRAELPQTVDLPPDEAPAVRAEIVDTFQGIRRDVDSLLIRLGRDPEELAAWQDIE